MDTKKDLEDAKRHHLAKSFKEEKITQFHGNYILMFLQKFSVWLCNSIKPRNVDWLMCVLTIFGKSKSFVGIFVINIIIIFLLIHRCYFFNKKHISIGTFCYKLTAYIIMWCYYCGMRFLISWNVRCPIMILVKVQ